MKTKILKVFIGVLAVVAAGSVNAQAYLQDPRYGNTPEERKANVITLNSFNDYVTTKDYDNALKQLDILLDKSPKATINLYIKGAMLYKNKIMKSTSVNEKNAYIDSLMMLYDKRIENFANYTNQGRDMGAGYTSQLKVRDYLQFKPTDRAGIRKMFAESMKLNSYDVPADFGLLYFNELVDDYKNDEIEADMVLNEYAKLGKVIDSADTDDKDTFEALFASSGVANCNTLEAMYKPKFEANPNDSSFLATAFNLMSKANCTSDLYIDIAEKYYTIAPSANIAVRLAAVCENRRDYTKALKYLNESLATEKDPIQKSNLYVRIAASELGAGRSSSAGQAARSAMSLNPDNGYAYMMLAQAYAIGASACGGIQGQSVYWLVVDVLGRARALLADDPSQAASVDSQISRYRSYFPTKEDCFFNGMHDGAGYEVRCGWISGSTVVRSR